MLEVKPTQLEGVLELTPERFCDSRGFLCETFNEKRFGEAGIDCHFVQDNQSHSQKCWTLRGLHFQAPPHAQAKLVRVLRGAIFDVAVDIRSGSPTFGKWVGQTLTAQQGNQLFVPEGFAHGFLTLENDCEVAYKTSRFYNEEASGHLWYDDPEVAIAWPLGGNAPVLSKKDENAPLLRDSVTPFNDA